MIVIIQMITMKLEILDQLRNQQNHNNRHGIIDKVRKMRRIKERK